MNTNDITLDHFPTCCARLIKDNASNVVNQGLCPNKAKVLQQGNLRGSLFNKGNGDTVVGLCKTHANVSNRKPINVHLSNTNLNNKENTMTTEQLHWAFEDDCDENNEGYLIFEGTCDMCDATGQMRYGYSARNDGVKVPVITHCADGCAMYIDPCECGNPSEGEPHSSGCPLYVAPVKPKGYISCGNCRKNGSPTPWHRNINEAKICYAHRS